MKRLFEDVLKKVFKTDRKSEDRDGSRSEHLLEENPDDQQKFDHDFRVSLIELEDHLHAEEDYDAIVMQAIQSAYDFYDADWAGILTADSGSQMWSATRWISRQSGANKSTLFDENEYFENYPQWVESLSSGKALVIEDVGKLTDISESEINHYKKLEVQGVIGVPYGLRPSGFMVIKNPRRYKTKPDYLKMMAFVGLSSYYQQQLIEGMRMMREDNDVAVIEDGDTIRINVFGVPELVTPAGSINEQQFKSTQGWKLLTYMVLKNHATPSRVIAMDIWPDKNVDSRTDAVRNIIYRFKQKVSFLETSSFLIRGDTGYVFNPDLSIKSDVWEFDRLREQISGSADDGLKIELLQKAMSLYKGTIYREYADEEWLRMDAQTYEIAYIHMVNMLLELLAKQGDSHQVCDVARESLKKVSGNLIAYQYLVAALNAMGAVDSAKMELEGLKHILDKEEYDDLISNVERISFGDDKNAK